MTSARRGTSNANDRGSSYQRRKRKEAVLSRDGTVVNGLVVVGCFASGCGTVLTFETMTLERITPGCDGGKYTLDNVVPYCGPCNSREGGAIRRSV